MNASVMDGNIKGYVGFDFDKEEKHMDMIKTEKYKNYGQLEDRVNGMADVEMFVFHNGELVQDIPFPGLPDNIDTTLRLMNK